MTFSTNPFYNKNCLMITRVTKKVSIKKKNSCSPNAKMNDTNQMMPMSLKKSLLTRYLAIRTLIITRNHQWFLQKLLTLTSKNRKTMLSKLNLQKIQKCFTLEFSRKRPRTTKLCFKKSKISISTSQK